MTTKILNVTAILSLGLISGYLVSSETVLPDIDNQSFINECVQTHNYYRSRVNPPASNMRYMTWDHALAKTARAWARKCQFKHNIHLQTPGKVHPEFSPVGENLWAGAPVPSFNASMAVKNWYDEVKDYDYASRACSKVCGHYTQVVWDESYKVGCAVQKCSSISGTNMKNGAIFVCNYGPAGNYPRRPYSKGRPCSACSNELCRNGLCSYGEWNPGWDSHLSCDSYCIASLVIRVILFLLTFLAVFMLQKKFPNMFVYEQ
ncbi:glioma pathogenesis-related protein 1 isoform X2 [Protopterus annectens]|uniref:glioma pathogenesis-related protein 1 isoform X2 n=1 Tax=Protopterus annectens TaxID=7888 RepID=UPI001CFB679B|nr:glioma pathogenesis-related protein 1 isoform X2 [Protopterus annectens]